MTARVGVAMALGAVAGIVLAGQVQVGLGVRGNRSAGGSEGAVPEDAEDRYAAVRDAVRARVRAVDARLRTWIRRTIRRAGDDPETTEFDPNVYSFSKEALGRALGVPVLGHGYSRVVARVAPGIVAKFPWREDGVARNEAELEVWDREGADVRALLLPPLDYVRPPGVSVFPEARPLLGEGVDADSLALRVAKARWIDLFNARWDALTAGQNDVNMLTSDIENWNWGVYEGRMVLLDYEPEEG